LAITISDSGSDDGKSKAKDSSNKGEGKGQEMNKVIKSKNEFVGNFEAWRARVRRGMDEEKARRAANASSSALQDVKSEADSMAAHASSSALIDTQPESDPESQLPDF
jgi:hypothetical protein